LQRFMVRYRQLTLHPVYPFVVNLRDMSAEEKLPNVPSDEKIPSTKLNKMLEIVQKVLKSNEGKADEDKEKVAIYLHWTSLRLMVQRVSSVFLFRYYFSILTCSAVPQHGWDLYHLHRRSPSLQRSTRDD
jgi:hypothetical protein